MVMPIKLNINFFKNGFYNEILLQFYLSTLKSKEDFWS